MQKFLFLAFTMFAFQFPCSELFADTPTTTPYTFDFSTPKSAATAFLVARRSGDRDDIQEAVAYDYDSLESKVIAEDAYANATYLKMIDESIKKFGLDGGKLRELKKIYKEKEEAAKEVEAGEAKVDGDQATITYKDEFDRKIILHLIHSDNGWRIYFPDLDKIVVEKREKVTMALATALIFGETSRRIIRDIQDDQYKTVEEATEGFKKVSIDVQDELENNP